MSVPIPQRATYNEYRYDIAFFQRGTKVLTPVHGYGCCSKATKGLAKMTKRIYFPNMSLGDMFRVGQRIGVCVSEIEIGETNYWSDGTISVINDTSHYLDVLLDTAISIAYGGESEIDFISVLAENPDRATTHLWQTVDGKSYITTRIVPMTDRGGRVYTPYSIIANRLLPVSCLDKYIESIDVKSTKYFIMKAENGPAFTGAYMQYCTNAAPYTNHYQVPFYYGFQGQAAGACLNATAPIFWDRTGHCDGTTLWIAVEGDITHKTWYKDRPYLFRIQGELIPAAGETPGTFKTGTIVYICNPFNVSHTDSDHAFKVCAPSTVNDVQLPIDSNFWCDGEITDNPAGAVPFICDFRPEIDDNGVPFVKNVGNDASLGTSGDETIAVYDTTDIIKEQFTNCTFDVFVRSPENQNELLAGGQFSCDRYVMDIGNLYTDLHTIFRYDSLDNVYSAINKATYPVMLSKMNIIASAAPNRFTQSVGAWEDADYFNGKIWFVSGNVLKPTNALLEFDPVDTIEIPSVITGIKALANMLFVFSENGVYTVNLDNKVEFLSAVVGRQWAVVRESLYVVDDRGKIFNTEFTPVPVQDQRKITQNPYIMLEENTKMINDIVEQWTVFDMASAQDMLWVASNMGLWACESSTKAWFKVSNDVFIKLVSTGNDIFGITGELDSEEEMISIDLIKLLENDHAEFGPQ